MNVEEKHSCFQSVGNLGQIVCCPMVQVSGVQCVASQTQAKGEKARKPSVLTHVSIDFIRPRDI